MQKTTIIMGHDHTKNNRNCGLRSYKKQPRLWVMIIQKTTVNVDYNHANNNRNNGLYISKKYMIRVTGGKYEL